MPRRPGPYLLPPNAGTNHSLGVGTPCPPVPATVQNARMSEQHLVIRRGRHVGWWIQGRAGRGFIMFDWWPTKRIALMVGRFWVRAAKRASAGEITIEVRDTTE